MAQTEELQDLAGLGAELVDTLDADDEDELGGLGDVEGALGAGDTLQTDFFAFSTQVLLDVALGALEDLFSLLASSDTGSFFSRGKSNAGLFDGLALLQDVEGNSGKGVLTTKEKEKEKEINKLLNVVRIKKDGIDREKMVKRVSKDIVYVNPLPVPALLCPLNSRTIKTL